MSIENYFLLISILEWLASFDLTCCTCGDNARSPCQSRQVASQQIHHYCFSNIVSIVSCDYVFYSKACSSSVKGLSTKNATVCTVALFPNLLDNLVHGPSIKFIVANNLQGHIVLHSITLHGFKAIISVAFDAFVDRQEHEVEAVTMTFIKCLQDRSEDGGVLTARRTNGYRLT